MTTLVHLLAERAATTPQGIAHRSHHLGLWEPLTWAELADRVARLATALEGHGVGSGDRVLLLSATSSNWIVADLAVHALGAVTVVLPDTATEDEVARAIEQHSCRVVFAGDQEQFDKVMDRPGRSAVLTVVDRTRGLRYLDTEDRDPMEYGLALSKAMAGAAAVPLSARLGALVPDAAATIVPTASGWVTLSHRSLVELGRSAQTALGLGAEEQVLSVTCPAVLDERQLSEAGALVAGYPVAFGLGGALQISELAEVQPTVAHLPVSLLARIDGDIARRRQLTTGLKRRVLEAGLRAGRKSGATGSAKGALRRVIAVSGIAAALALAANGYIQSHQPGSTFDENGFEVPTPATKVLGLAEPAWWMPWAVILVVVAAVVFWLARSGYGVLPFIRKKYGLLAMRALSSGTTDVAPELAERLRSLGVPLSPRSWVPPDLLTTGSPRPVSTAALQDS